LVGPDDLSAGRYGTLFHMLVIRPEQMAVFSRSVEEAFKAKLALHLEAFLEAKGVHVAGEALRAQIDRGLAQCNDFGLERQCDVARMFEIVCGSLGGFTDGSPSKDALNILYGYRVDSELKLRRLQALANAQSKEGR
jgi:hypothetical protein